MKRAWLALALVLAAPLAAQSEDEPPLLQDGKTARGDAAAGPRLRVANGASGVRRLLFRHAGGQARASVLTVEQVSDTPTVLYRYRCGAAPAEVELFPVLSGAEYQIMVSLDEDPAGPAPFEILIEPYTPTVTAETTARAREAVRRAVAHLGKTAPDAASDGEYAVAIESLVLATLADGEGRAGRAARVDADFVAWLERQFVADPETGAGAGGQPLSRPSEAIYQDAIAGFALGEAAAAGSARARKLCAPVARYLIASQQSAHKSAAWGGPISGESASHGGWRYTAADTSGDISATGWCAVALTAIDAADVRVDGLADSLRDATAFVARSSGEFGFTYIPGTDGSGNIRNAIGAFVSQLQGLEPDSLGTALADLDRHLPALTQVDVGEDYPMYYLYYGTRVSYLRGGEAWRRWRAIAIRQLLRHQRADGSWRGYGGEEAVGDRYATALAVMVLRLCLGEVPSYLRAEVRGF